MSANPPPQPNSAGPAGYHVARPAGVCAVTARPIQPDEPFMAALRETPIGLQRLDVGLESWDAFDKSDLLGFWRTNMPRPGEKKQIFVDDELLCGLFERLADAAEPSKIAFRFVLGLILMRKRKLAYQSTETRDGADHWIVKLRGRDESFDMLDPKLDESQTLDVSAQLSEILNGDL